jgi:hypothetical protein
MDKLWSLGFVWSESTFSAIECGEAARVVLNGAIRDPVVVYGFPYIPFEPTAISTPHHRAPAALEYYVKTAHAVAACLATRFSSLISQ